MSNKIAMLDCSNINRDFERILESEDWKSLQDSFNKSKDIYIIGHAGNLAIADYAAACITKLTNRTKNATAPGSAIVMTLHTHDSSFDDAFKIWLINSLINKTQEQIESSLVIGLSSSGTSLNVINALEWANSKGMSTACITARSLVKNPTGCTEVVLNVEYYYLAETITQILLYQLSEGAGYDIPKIKKTKNTVENLVNEEKSTIGIDFDGVIHKNSKGYHDGTVYDDPIDGVEDALKTLSDKYKLVCFTAKAKPNRPFVNGKTGKELVKDWLVKYDLDKYISDITSEKPRAVIYIDDKSVRFNDWSSCLVELKEQGII